MTIMEAISRTDGLKQNTYTQDEKIAWLNKLDGMVKKFIIDTHEGGEGVTFSGYTGETDLNTELLVPEPFTDVYQRWLEAQIDLTNGEYDKYNASITLFDREYQHFADAYHRSHTPKSNGRFVF